MMLNHNKRHQNTLHYCLASKRMSQDEFSILTSLTNDEIELFFSEDRRYILNVVKTIGQIAQYQKSRIEKNLKEFSLLRQALNQKLYLWSDSLKICKVPDTNSINELGLALLSQYNHRQATIWSIRLGIELPRYVIAMSQSFRLEGLILNVLDLYSQENIKDDEEVNDGE